MTERLSGTRAAVAFGGLAAALALIAFATLRPVYTSAPPTPILCLACGDLGGVDVTLNVALFIPLGVALGALGVPWRRAIAIAGGLSLLIESLQFSVIPGRDTSFSDLLTNTVGGAIGAYAALRWRAFAAPSFRQAQRLSLAGALAAVATMGATAALLHPSIPPMWLWGQWTPQRQQFESYSGHVAVFRINDTPIPYSKVTQWDSLRQTILRHDAVVHVEFVSGSQPLRLAAIARLVGEGQEVLLIGAKRDALVFRARLAVRDWRLRSPFVSLPGVLGPKGENVTAEAGLLRDGWRMQVETPRGTFRRFIPFSIALGWSFLLPFEHPMAPHDVWWSALWLAALAFPAAFWGALAVSAADAPRRRLGAIVPRVVPVALVAGGVAIIPRIAQFAPASPVEWTGVALGIVCGALLAPVARRLASRAVSS